MSAIFSFGLRVSSFEQPLREEGNFLADQPFKEISSLVLLEARGS